MYICVCVCEPVLISIQAPSLGVINGTVRSGTFSDLFNQQAQHHTHIQLGEELGDRLSRIPLLVTDGFPPEGPVMIRVQNTQPGPEVVQDLGAIGIAIERPTAWATGVRAGQEQSPKGGAHGDLEVQACQGCWLSHFMTIPYGVQFGIPMAIDLHELS